MADEKNHAETIERLTKNADAKPVILKTENGREYAFYPIGGQPNGPPQYKMELLTSANEVMPKPAILRQEPKLQSATAFVEYVNRFKNSETVIFADASDEQIIAAIDYHKADGSPANVGHRAFYSLALSSEWQQWCAIDDCLLPQQKFAQFIEENAQDIVDPQGGALLDMILDMEKGVTVRVARRLRSAGSDVGDKVNHRTTDGTELPPRWKLKMPVFFGEPAVEVTAFARDRLDDGKITVGFKLSRVETIRQNEVLRIAKQIGDATGVPTVLGSMT